MEADAGVNSERGKKVGLIRQGLIPILLAAAVTLSLVFMAPTPANAEASLSAAILSYDKIGIDQNNPDVAGPDKSIVQVRIGNNGDATATNVVAAFQWTTVNTTYVSLSPDETPIQSLGNLAPDEYADVFWVVEIARDKDALDTTRSYRIDVTSDQTSATVAQTLTVEGLQEQAQDYSAIVHAPSTVILGQTFIVEVEAAITRRVAYVSFPLQFDRSLFELKHVRLDYYQGTNQDPFEYGLSYTEDDIYYSSPEAIEYKGMRGYYTFRATRPGTGTFASLQIDTWREVNFHYNSDLWEGGVEVICSSPALTISKSDSPDPVPAGDTITYTITYGNTGTTDATNVVITDSVPDNTSYVSDSAYGPEGVTVEYSDGVITWGVGTLDHGVTGQEVGFQVVVDPTVAGGSLIENRAAITSSQLPQTAVEVTTVTYLDPAISISKSGSPDAVSPGGTITYNITYYNPEDVDAINVEITDSIPVNTTYELGSATGGGIYDEASRTLTWDLGTVAGHSGGSVSFQVMVNTGVGGGTIVENSATIDGDNIPQATSNIVTTTVLGPNIEAYKLDSFSLSGDNDLNGVVSPGDNLLYQVTISNSGNQDASGVTFSDTPGDNTELVVGSVTTSELVTSGNTPGDTSVEVFVDTLADGGSVIITFEVIIDRPLSAGVTQVSNQGSVSGTNFVTELTDDPDTLAEDDPTVTSVKAVDIDPAWKQDSLFDDADGNGVASPGDTLLYEVTIWNDGDLNATGVIFTDTPDPNTTLVSGFVTSTSSVDGGPPTPKGIVEIGNNPGDTSIKVDVDELLGLGLEKVTISFRVTIRSDLPVGVTHVYNQGLVSSNEVSPQRTDDPYPPGDGDPTGTPLGPRGPARRGVPAFPSVYVGIAVALGAGVLAYFVRRRLLDQE